MPFIILITIVLIEHLPENNKVGSRSTFDNIVGSFQVIQIKSDDKKGHNSFKRATKQEVAKKFGRVFLPVVQVIFVLSYAGVACKLYSQ